MTQMISIKLPDVLVEDVAICMGCSPYDADQKHAIATTLEDAFNFALDLEEVEDDIIAELDQEHPYTRGPDKSVITTILGMAVDIDHLHGGVIHLRADHNKLYIVVP